MKRALLALLAATVLSACGFPDCLEQAGFNSCGYCSEERATSSVPHAGVCTYCATPCGPDACNPACGAAASRAPAP